MKINPKGSLSHFAGDLEGMEVFFPIRQDGDDGHEFILMSEWGAGYEDASSKGVHTDVTCGNSYAKTNPVLRIAKVKIIICELMS